MNDELSALILLYRKSKDSQTEASKDRVILQGRLRDAVAKERKASLMLEQLQPLIHQMPGGPEALQELGKDLASIELVPTPSSSARPPAKPVKPATPAESK